MILYKTFNSRVFIGFTKSGLIGAASKWKIAYIHVHCPVMEESMDKGRRSSVFSKLFLRVATYLSIPDHEPQITEQSPNKEKH